MAEKLSAPVPSMCQTDSVTSITQALRVGRKKLEQQNCYSDA